jgi:hypothetical protein
MLRRSTELWTAEPPAMIQTKFHISEKVRQLMKVRLVSEEEVMVRMPE